MVDKQEDYVFALIRLLAKNIVQMGRPIAEGASLASLARPSTFGPGGQAHQSIFGICEAHPLFRETQQWLRFVNIRLFAGLTSELSCPLSKIAKSWCRGSCASPSREDVTEGTIRAN